ncbi:T7SS effector LXG polymorphic toxin [Eubacterium ramulus]|jgi:hypothetical protein|uniref:T7SS effector LXG polymorphic toxin n=1 Tax=Eubacterium ramulus TaxID=39490 RepID=UPI003522FC37
MASQGSLKLKSTSLLDMYNAIHTYESTVQDALYEQYKAAYKLTVTNYMRGSAADAFKTYFSKGTVNLIQSLLDISSEMTMILQLITEVFYQFESASNGTIFETQLDEVGSNLDGKKSTYEGMENEISSVMGAASQYINIVDVGYADVYDAYGQVTNMLQQIRTDLYSVDADAVVSAQELLTRIQELKSQITQTMGLCYKDGNFMPDQAVTLSNQSWYTTQTNATLTLLLSEDPFEYEAGAVSVSEDQWAAGLCSDVYAYAGYSFLNASYESGVENNTAFMKARASVLNLNGYAQLTDYIKAQGEAKVGYAETDLKIGAGDGYFGAHVKAEAGVIKVNGSVVAGTDNFNGYIKGNADVLNANGNAAFEFEDDGQFAIGVDAGASLASAGIEGGFNFLSYKVYDGTATGDEKDDLFKVKVRASANAGGSFAVYAESKKAIDLDIADINATTLKIKGEFLLGGNIEITVPTIYMKWPW